MANYLPQDTICWCGKRIGDHNGISWWPCLDKASRAIKQLQKTLEANGRLQ